MKFFCLAKKRRAALSILNVIACASAGGAKGPSAANACSALSDNGRQEVEVLLALPLY